MHKVTLAGLALPAERLDPPVLDTTLRWLTWEARRPVGTSLARVPSRRRPRPRLEGSMASAGVDRTRARMKQAPRAGAKDDPRIPSAKARW